MEDKQPQEATDRPSWLTVGIADTIVAALFVLLGAVVIYDSRRIGAGWAADGPQAGYFPFYVGLLMAVSGAAVLAHTVRGWVHHRAWFATRNQLVRVRAVLLPTALYVAAVYWVGIYVASTLFIAWFMVRHGHFRWAAALPVSLGVPLAFFLLFDRWFLVPLPKGPLERLLGL